MIQSLQALPHINFALIIAVLSVGLHFSATVHGASCTSKLVGVRTGTSTTCSQDIVHYYPVGDTSLCYGWASTDSSHINSAKDIQCVEATTFSFVQYAGNLNCQGTGVFKTVKLNDCEQDYPPAVYTVGIDLACCADPNGAACKTDVPYATSNGGSLIYADGQLCDGEEDTSGPSTSPTTAPTESDTSSPSMASSTSPTTLPTDTDTSSPSVSSTTSSECEDSSLSFKVFWNGKTRTKDCSWVANKPNTRCAEDGVSAICSSTCGTCSTCADSSLTFKLFWNGKTRNKDCTWVERKPNTRCAEDGVSQTCRESCGEC